MGDADDPAAALSASQLREAVGRYYQTRGWDAEGRIPEQQLAEFGLSDL